MLNPPHPHASPLGPLAPLLKNLALAYLLLPVLLFLACWLRLAFAIPALLALGFALWRCRASSRADQFLSTSRAIPLPTHSHQPASGFAFGTQFSPASGTAAASPAAGWQHGAMLLYCLALAGLFCLWTVPAPVGLPFWDYAKHDVLLHNLVDYPWPVTFFTETGSATVLRYTLAYYLPPALLAKCLHQWLGGEWAQLCLFGWTLLGVWLFFAFVASRVRRWPLALLAVPLAALFGGLDVLAYWGVNGSLHGFGTALVNAWSRPYACGWLIGSTPFAFHFTPQHALASSLGAVILLDNWHSSRFWRHAALAVVALVLWSPFVAFSFGVIALARLPGKDFWAQWRALCVPANLALLPVLAMLLVFVLSSAQAIPLLWCPAGGDVARFAVRYALFAVLEFGLLAALVLAMLSGSRGRWRRLVLAALGLLCTLMFTWVGTSNDLQMRGSNLPMVVLLLLAIQALQESASYGKNRDNGKKRQNKPYGEYEKDELVAKDERDGANEKAGTDERDGKGDRSGKDGRGGKDGKFGPHGLRGALLVTLLLGCVGGWQELQRVGLNWHITRTALREPVFAVNWFADNESMNYSVVPQYLARLSHAGWAYKMLRRQPGALALTLVVPALQDLHWNSFGEAQFDLITRSVQSDGMTDAALCTDALALPAGLYRIDLQFDWDARAEPDDGTPRAVHVSILGQRKLAAFGSGSVKNRAVTLFVRLDGQPVRLAFGLGGWGKASGRVQLRAGSISRIGAASSP